MNDREALATEIVVTLMGASDCPVVVGNGSYDHASLLASHLADLLAEHVRAKQAGAWALGAENALGQFARPLPESGIRPPLANPYVDALAPTAEPDPCCGSFGTKCTHCPKRAPTAEPGVRIAFENMPAGRYRVVPAVGGGITVSRVDTVPAPTAEEAKPEPGCAEFNEDVDDYSMCVCGVPRLIHR